MIEDDSRLGGSRFARIRVARKPRDNAFVWSGYGPANNGTVV
jgi:hypothetical protein